MYQKTLIVRNPSGLHARPASEFVALAKSFTCDVSICRAGQTPAVNAKSMVKLLTLGICQGEELTISATGEGEEQAVEKLGALIVSGFDES